jgi:hypothetical protein
MDYRRLIRNWHEKSGGGDYFSKFVFEYLAFVAHLKTQKYPSEDGQRSIGDRDAIQKLKKDEETKQKYFELLQQDEMLRTAWEKIKAELDRSPLGNVSWNPEYAEEIKWWNCSHEDLKDKTSEEKRKPSGVLHSLDDWENMIEFWYSIRNNLFHGGKDPAVERDQLVVEFGYKTLRVLMQTFLHDW